jgi:hypothetical protein
VAPKDLLLIVALNIDRNGRRGRMTISIWGYHMYVKPMAAMTRWVGKRLMQGPPIAGHVPTAIQRRQQLKEDRVR